MPDRHAQRPDSQGGSGIRSRFLNREVLGIACLSTASVLAIILVVWGCVSRGNCEHSGPDTCESRINLPGLERYHHHMSEDHQRQPQTGPDEQIKPLGFQGNADFYGLGIRLGIYFQWVASLVANAVLDNNIRQTTTAPYVGFQIAVLAALLLLVFRPDCTFTAEVIVIIYILLGGVFIVLAPEIVQSFRHVQWKDEKRPKYRLFSTFVWILVGFVVPVSAWFWIRLASDLDRPDFNRTPGGTSMFFFAQIKEPGTRVASVFMAIWSLVLGLFALEKVTLAFLYRALEAELPPSLFILLDVVFYIISTSFVLLKTAIRHVITSYEKDSCKPLSEVIHDALKLRKDVALEDIARTPTALGTRLYAFALAMFSIVMSICSVELTLAWNHVTGVNSLASTGQIVPFFVGGATLLSVIWELAKKAKAKPRFKKTKGASIEIETDAQLYDHEASMWQSVDKIDLC